MKLALWLLHCEIGMLLRCEIGMLVRSCFHPLSVYTRSSMSHLYDGVGVTASNVMPEIRDLVVSSIMKAGVCGIIPGCDLPRVSDPVTNTMENVVRCKRGHKHK